MANIQKNKCSFAKDTGANISAVFAVLAVPLAVAAGGAMDFATAVSIKAKMQNALDAATTAVCADSSQDPDTVIRKLLTTSIGEFGLELMPAPVPGETVAVPTGAQAIVLDTEFDQTTGTIKPKLSTNMPTTLLQLGQIDQIELKTMSEISCGAKKLELSLMLDVTGSMGTWVNGESRLESMKTAANDVFNIFERNMEEGSTRIALVPFSRTVNVGSAMAETIRGNVGTITKTTGPWWYRRTYTYYPTSCVVERYGADAFTDTAPGVGTYFSTYYSTSGSCSPSAEIQPLTSNVDTLRNEVLGYTASGATAGHLGTSWAWNVISPKWSSVWPQDSQPEQADPDRLIKATILMTDGDYNTQYCNTQSTGSCWNAPNGSSFTQAQTLCTNMKGDGVVVYAVGFGISEESYAAQQLKACATDETKWFFPYDGDELRAAFQSIGRSLAAGQSGQAIIKQ